MTNNIKLCECGCGNPAPIAQSTNRNTGYVKGQPKRFVSGHNSPKLPPIDESKVTPRLCECGCGKVTPIARDSDATRGHIRGERMRFAKNHHAHRTLEESFRDGAIPGAPGECWEWQGSIATSGYGELSHRRKQHYVHRVSWELHFGPIPDNLWVLHKCDNPRCWNPEHLFLGTCADNVEDKVKKERQLRGTDIPSSKLNDEKVIEIRRLAKTNISNRQIARQFGVEVTTIWNIVNGKRWKHVP